MTTVLFPVSMKNRSRFCTPTSNPSYLCIIQIKSKYVCPIVRCFFVGAQYWSRVTVQIIYNIHYLKYFHSTGNFTTCSIVVLEKKCLKHFLYVFECWIPLGAPVLAWMSLFEQFRICTILECLQSNLTISSIEVLEKKTFKHCPDKFLCWTLLPSNG